MKPSVSDLIKLLDKPALVKWANKKGLEGINIDDYRKGVRSKGSGLHRQIEQYLKHQEPFENESTFDNFKRFIDGKEVVSIETPFEGELFNGRFDIKLVHEGHTYICDFKSSLKRIYLENILQLVAYKMVDNCDRVAIVSMPDFTFKEIFLKDEEPYRQMLINLTNIYHLKKQIEANGYL